MMKHKTLILIISIITLFISFTLVTYSYLTSEDRINVDFQMASLNVSAHLEKEQTIILDSDTFDTAYIDVYNDLVLDKYHQLDNMKHNFNVIVTCDNPITTRALIKALPSSGIVYFVIFDEHPEQDISLSVVDKVLSYSYESDGLQHQIISFESINDFNENTVDDIHDLINQYNYDTLKDYYDNNVLESNANFSFRIIAFSDYYGYISEHNDDYLADTVRLPIEISVKIVQNDYKGVFDYDQD